MSCIDKRVLVSFTYMTDTDGFGMRKTDDSAKTKALKGKEIASGIEKSGGKVVRYEDVDKVNRMLLNSGEKHTYKHSPPGRTKLPKWSSYNK